MTGPILFLVPARAGSRRVPGKNLRTVAGIPLVGWAVRAARLAAAGVPGTGHVVACSADDPEIAAAALAWGADRIVDRPAALAGDAATSVDVALHALDALTGSGPAFRALALVQPTSPLTDATDIRAALDVFDAGAPAVVSVTPAHPADWHLDLDAGRIRPVNADGGSHLLTGAFYVIEPGALRRQGRFLLDGVTAAQVVPPDRSIDIDEELDLTVAEGVLAARLVRPVPLGSRTIGRGSVVTIAEVGVNHNGDVELAHRLIDAVAETGADVVKFQTFDPVALAAAGAPTAAYQRAAVGAADDQRGMLERLALPVEAWARLQTHAADRGLLVVVFFSGEDKMIVGDRRLPRIDRGAAGDLIERVNRKRRGAVRCRQQVGVDP